jgi:hypothetical protein
VILSGTTERFGDDDIVITFSEQVSQDLSSPTDENEENRRVAGNARLFLPPALRQ